MKLHELAMQTQLIGLCHFAKKLDDLFLQKVPFEIPESLFEQSNAKELFKKFLLQILWNNLPSEKTMTTSGMSQIGHDGCAMVRYNSTILLNQCSEVYFYHLSFICIMH